MFGKAIGAARKFRALLYKLNAHAFDSEALHQQHQRQIANQYALFRQQGTLPYTHIRDAGFRIYSQFEEDGILLYLFSMIGFESRRVVEMCCGTGDECMATNLILNHGFEGFLFDGSEANVAEARRFFASKKDMMLGRPDIRQSWITAENVDQLLTEAGCTGEVDLFSLDIDGNDYWVWKAITVMRPRVLLFETHGVIPSNLSLTIPYQPAFDAWSQTGAVQDFRSVSLLAMTKLCRDKGYRLVGGHRHGFNAFYLRDDVGRDLFPEVSVESVHDNPYTRAAQRDRWPLVRDMDWVEV